MGGSTTNGTGVDLNGNVTNGTVSGNASGNGTGVDMSGNVTNATVNGTSSNGTGVNISGNSSATNSTVNGTSTNGTGVIISGNLTNNNTTVNGNSVYGADVLITTGSVSEPDSVNGVGSLGNSGTGILQRLRHWLEVIEQTMSRRTIKDAAKEVAIDGKSPVVMRNCLDDSQCENIEMQQEIMLQSNKENKKERK